MAPINGLGSSCTFTVSGADLLYNGLEWGSTQRATTADATTWTCGDWEDFIFTSKNQSFVATLIEDDAAPLLSVGLVGTLVATFMSGRTLTCSAGITEINWRVPKAGRADCNVTLQAKGAVTELPSTTASEGGDI